MIFVRAVLGHATCPLIVLDWCQSQHIYQVTSVASLHVFTLRRRASSRHQLDAIASGTNVVVVVEALSLQTVTLPLTACLNLVGRTSRETLCLFRICRVYFSRWSAPWSCSSPPKMRWKPSSAICLCQRCRKIIHGLVSWLIVAGIQAFSHNSEIWHDGSADFTFLNVRHVGKNVMILSLSSKGSTGGKPWEGNVWYAANLYQPCEARYSSPYIDPKTHIWCKKCLEWISRRYPCDCSQICYQLDYTSDSS